MNNMAEIIKAIAISSGTRFPGLPDLPSIGETLPGAVMDGFFAILDDPAKVQRQIVRLCR